MAALYEVLNRANDMVWTGAFTFWDEQKLMVWRYGLPLAGGQVASLDQIEQLIELLVAAAASCLAVTFSGLAARDRLTYTKLKVKRTQDWTTHRVTFNSLDHDEAREKTALFRAAIAGAGVAGAEVFKADRARTGAIVQAQLRPHQRSP